MAEFTSLLKANRIPRKQKGQRIETRSAFFLRYYVNTTDKTGVSVRKQECVKLADKSDQYRSWKDVEPLISRVLENVNKDSDLPTGQMSLTDFTDKHYFPWAEKNKAAATTNGYKRVWEKYLKPDLAAIALTNLQTVQVTAVLTKHASKGLGSRTLGHIKWMLSGVYQYAIASGVIGAGANPAEAAEWLVRVRRTPKAAVYTLEQVQMMLRILTPLDLRAAVAVALAYFAALRPAEIRGLQWEDYDGNELSIKRSVWRNHVGETKTEESEAVVFVIEPLRSMLEKLRLESDGKGYILKNGSNKPLSLDSLNYRIITPTLKKAGIEWAGYYACRRGMSSLITADSKDALNATGLLRHSTPITALKHYTRAQKDSIVAAMRQIETKALAMAKE
ncbi:MAG TPA: site-specific integrase, partial [Terriglobales bacterium]|nr:site-specific integrase [Terriglobales bacterium]